MNGTWLTQKELGIAEKMPETLNSGNFRALVIEIHNASKNVRILSRKHDGSTNEYILAWTDSSASNTA